MTLKVEYEPDGFSPDGPGTWALIEEVIQNLGEGRIERDTVYVKTWSEKPTQEAVVATAQDYRLKQAEARELSKDITYK